MIDPSYLGINKKILIFEAFSYINCKKKHLKSSKSSFLGSESTRGKCFFWAAKKGGLFINRGLRNNVISPQKGTLRRLNKRETILPWTSSDFREEVSAGWLRGATGGRERRRRRYGGIYRKSNYQRFLSLPFLFPSRMTARIQAVTLDGRYMVSTIVVLVVTVFSFPHRYVTSVCWGNDSFLSTAPNPYGSFSPLFFIIVQNHSLIQDMSFVCLSTYFRLSENIEISVYICNINSEFLLFIYFNNLGTQLC